MGHSVSRLRKRVNQGLTIRRHSARTASASRARGRSAAMPASARRPRLRFLSRLRLVNQRIGFLRFAAAVDLHGVWHGREVSGCGER